MITPIRLFLIDKIHNWSSHHSHPASVEDIQKFADEILPDMGALSTFDKKLKDELQGLAAYILQAKREIASLRPDSTGAHQIPAAADELDAVVGATEEATNKIMDVCDEIAVCAEALPAAMKNQLIAHNTRIFEACNFQDITGQRITKVVKTLKHIDEKINALLTVLGDPAVDIADAGRVYAEALSDPLLNGPQLPGQGMDQETIDQLLSDI